MILKQSVYVVAILVLTFSGLTPNTQAQSNSKKPDSSVVVGTLKNVDSSGKKFTVQQNGESLRNLYLDSKSKVYFIGLPANGKQKPMVGQGVKATADKDGRVKTISFTPPVGETKMLGEKRLKMTETELLKEVDKDSSNSISYVEFSKYIHNSPKHGPDSFRKADKDSDGALDKTEFAAALGKVSWWKISRKSPNAWFIQADQNRDGMLDIQEFGLICPSGNHLKNIFKRADRDKSDSLNERETEAYIRSITHGKEKSKQKRKRDEKVTTQSGKPLSLRAL